MPYNPTVTFAPNTILEADDLNTNFNEITDYIVDGIDAPAEIKDDSITTTKILRPSYRQITPEVTITELQTGLIIHLRWNARDYYANQPLTSIPYQPQGFMAKPYHDGTLGRDNLKPVPGSWVSYYAQEEPNYVLVRALGEMVIPDDNTSAPSPPNDINRLHIRHGTTDSFGSTCIVLEGVANRDEANAERRHFATVALFRSATDNVVQGWNHVGLMGGLASNFAIMGSLEMTIEVFY